MALPTFQVSQLIAVLNQTLEVAYPSVVVEGEVASYKLSKGKYVFFDIKDQDGSLNCFMMAYQVRQPLEDGMKVRLVGQPRITAWGKFSLTVRDVSPLGEGSIKRAFQLLHAKLEKEGLFDPARKRVLPSLPGRIGMVASVESAGYADFLKILNSRWGGIDVQVADVQVQGLGAAAQIIRAVDHFNQLPEPPEALVLVRGGGSAEDLAVFNDEQLVRAIATSRTPTLVGVGHETDTSLCDLAADVRAATPSNAAQILVPDRKALAAELTQREYRLYERIATQLKSLQHLVADAPRLMLDRLDAAITERQQQLAQASRLLNQFDPKVVLQRGYALVHTVSHRLVRDPADVKAGDILTITLAHAILEAEVKHVRQHKN